MGEKTVRVDLRVLPQDRLYDIEEKCHTLREARKTLWALRAWKDLQYYNGGEPSPDIHFGENKNLNEVGIRIDQLTMCAEDKTLVLYLKQEEHEIENLCESLRQNIQTIKGCVEESVRLLEKKPLSDRVKDDIKLGLGYMKAHCDVCLSEIMEVQMRELEVEDGDGDPEQTVYSPGKGP
jgi:hypothetical protein